VPINIYVCGTWWSLSSEPHYLYNVVCSLNYILLLSSGVIALCYNVTNNFINLVSSKLDS